MSEHKAFASLSSGLLARKGSARPAMRRQGFGQVGPGGLDDLGWNDLGDPEYPEQDNEQAMIRMAQADQLEPLDEPEGEVVDAFKRNPISMLSPATSPVHDQRDEIEKAFGYEEGEEHHDGDDIYDETAEPWDEEEEGGMSLDLGVGNEAAPNFDEEPKLKRTVADLIPPAAPAAGEGTSNPLSDFSHLPTDLSNFGKPAHPAAETPAAEQPFETPVDESQDEAVAFDAPEDFVPFASEEEEPTAAFDSEAVEPEAIEPEVETAAEDDNPWARALEQAIGSPSEPAIDAVDETEDEPVADAASELVDALSAFEADAEDETEVAAESVEEPIEEPAETEVAEDADPFRVPFAEQEDEATVAEEQPAVEAATIETVEAVPVFEAEAPIDEPVVEGPPRVAAELSQVVDAIEPAPARSAGKGKAAFTLRLDQDRHLKLRLACALNGQSAQKFVTEALDAYLATIPNLDELVKKAPESRD